MFTGIIKARAQIRKAKIRRGSLFLTIEKPRSWKIKVGDSIATDGACLTVKKVRPNDYEYETELMPETLSKTTFGKRVPSRVNLELPMKALDTLAGHVVLGHVDGVGTILEIKSRGLSKIYKILFPAKFSKLIASKGSITVDGISLTVVKAGENWFTVSLVPYTLRHTTIGSKQKGDLVNLEFDIIAKYLARYGARSTKSRV